MSATEIKTPKRPATFKQKLAQFFKRRAADDTDTGDRKASVRCSRTSQKKPKVAKKTKKRGHGCSCWPFKRRQNSEEEGDEYTPNALGNIGLLLAGATMPEVADTHINVASRAALRSTCGMSKMLNST